MGDKAFDIKYLSRLSNWEDDVIGAYLLFIGISALCLNTLVIYTCLRHWRSLISSDFYILSLACSDILLPLLCFPLAILSSLCHHWVFGDTGCLLHGFFVFFFGEVSIATVAVMGIMRYISICQPQINVSSRKCIMSTTLFPYVYALVWSCLPLKLRGYNILEPYGILCTWQGQGQRYFTISMSLFCILIPLFVILFAYWQILLKYKTSDRNIRKRMTGRNRKKARKESFLMKMTLLMFWSFLVSWTPYMVVSLWSAYDGDSDHSVRFTVFAALMSRTSVVFNPIVYFLMSKKFRRLLKRSFSLPGSSKKWNRNHSWKVISELLTAHTKVDYCRTSMKTDTDFSSNGRKSMTRAALAATHVAVQVYKSLIVFLKCPRNV